MLRHHLLLILRNFKRHRSTYTINLFGLSIGLACTLLIYLWVTDEWSIDRFHEHEQHLYQVIQNVPLSNGILTTEGTPGLLAEALQREMPQVEEAAVTAYAPGGRNTGCYSGILYGI